MKESEELQRQLLYPRRTRRAAENGNCNFLFVHEGPRRTAKGHEEQQLQNSNCNSFFHGGHGGPRRTATAELPFFHEGPRRTTKNGNCNTFAHGGHGERQLQLPFFREGPRSNAKNCNGSTATPFSTKYASFYRLKAKKS